MGTTDDTLRSIHAQLRQIAHRQETFIMAVNANTDSIALLRAEVEKVVGWMNEPPSTALGDSIKEMAMALRAVEKSVAAMPQEIAEAVAGRPR